MRRSRVPISRLAAPAEIEVRSYSLGFRTNDRYVVEADLTILHRLANLRCGTIELQLDLQLLESIYLRDYALLDVGHSCRGPDRASMRCRSLRTSSR
jgi:hypothetical protein